MEQIEKVQKGLELCSTGTCMGSNCPYYHNVLEELKKFDCNTELAIDALALIRQQQERIKELEGAQTARVMTLEEVEDALDTVVWVEEPEFENFADHYALIMAYSHKVGLVRVFFGFAEMPVDCEYEYEDYGKKWRCWTKRPTDEQREAVKWDERDGRRCEEICKHAPPEKKWPCIDCDMSIHDRAEPPKEET